jgi:AAA15 family ATPase/GTPase
MKSEISRIEITDFLVFKGEFALDFCSGANVIIGENGTGKTTLMKAMYWACQCASESVLDRGNWTISRQMKTPYNHYFQLSSYFTNFNVENNEQRQETNSRLRIFNNSVDGTLPVLDASPSDNLSSVKIHLGSEDSKARMTLAQWCRLKPQAVFIPTTEMLSHARGLLALNMERQLPFDKTEIDILAKAELEPTWEITQNAKELFEVLREQIGGQVVFDGKEFYVEKDDTFAGRIPYSYEASGFRKLGLLWKLLRNGLLESGTILFWDEPEASINPELIPVLVDCLVKLQRGGVQIFVATHSEMLANEFNIRCSGSDIVKFFSLYKEKNTINAMSDIRFNLLAPNPLKHAMAQQYEREMVKGLGSDV